MNSSRKIIPAILDKRNDKRMHIIINQYNFGSVVDNSFKLTINTALGTGTTFTLPLPSGQIYDFYWNPGDGSAERHVTAYNDANAMYDYGVAFNGQISIGTHSGDKCGGWSFNNLGDKLKVISVDQWGEVDFDVINFYGCSNLNYVVNGEIPITSNCVSLGNIFRNCGLSLSPIASANWFKRGINVTSFGNSFSTSGIKGFEEDCFRYNINVTAFTALCSFTSNIVLPNRLFYYNNLVKNYGSVFFFSSNLTLGTEIFNLANIGIVSTFSGFMQSSGAIGTIQDIWNYATSATSTNAFINQTALTNYVDIPFDWKGMVEVGTLTTDQTTLQQVGITRTYTGIAEINWGDGTFTRTTSAVEALHTYAGTGTYDIKLGAATVTSTTQLIADNSRLTGVVGLKTGLLTNLSLYSNLLSGILELNQAPISGRLWLQNNLNLTNITFASSGNGLLNDTSFGSCNLTGVLDLSAVPVGGGFQSYSNLNLTGITFASSGNTKFTYFDISSISITALNLVNNPVGGTFKINACANLTGITFASLGNTIINVTGNNCDLTGVVDFSNVPVGACKLNDNPNLTNVIFAILGNTQTNIEIYNCNLTGVLDLSNKPLKGNINVSNNSNLTNIAFASSGNGLFGTFTQFQSCNLDYINLASSGFSLSANSIEIRLQNNAMIVADVNHILVDLYSLVAGEGVGGDYTGRIINISGTNAAPDGSSGGYDGLTAKTNLEGKGFTVTIT